MVKSSKIQFLIFALLILTNSLLFSQKDLDVMLGFQQADLIENGKDKLDFPDTIQIYQVFIGFLEKKAAKYYVLDSDDEFLYTIPYKNFHYNFPDNLRTGDLEIVPMDEIRYVDLKYRMIYGKERLFKTSKLVAFTNFAIYENNNVLQLALIGFVSDYLVTVLIGPIFPLLTTAASIVGLIIEYTKFKNEEAVNLKPTGIAKEYLISKDGLRFKYIFKYRDMDFNVEAMKSLKMIPINEND